MAAGHAALDWALLGEPVLGVFTAMMAAALLLMDWSQNIWVSYICYTLYKTLYMPLATICTFQIAKSLSKERYALVFGVNSLVGTALQTLLTSVVVDLLQLPITTQFFIYSAFFAVLSLLFALRGGYTVVHSKTRNKAGGGSDSTAAADRTSTFPAERRSSLSQAKSA